MGSVFGKTCEEKCENTKVTVQYASVAGSGAAGHYGNTPLGVAIGCVGVKAGNFDCDKFCSYTPSTNNDFQLDHNNLPG